MVIVIVAALVKGRLFGCLVNVYELVCAFWQRFVKRVTVFFCVVGSLSWCVKNLAVINFL